MISLPKNNEDEKELKENEYYWCYLNESFKLIKILNFNNKEIGYKESNVSFEEKEIKISDSLLENKMLFKEKINLKSFEICQLNPLSEDLANISNISYPSIMSNLKLKDQIGLHFTKAGKLVIGINYNNIKGDLSEQFLSNFFNGINNNPKNNQTIIVNGLPNTGKTNIIKNVLDKFLNINNNDKIKEKKEEENYFSNGGTFYEINLISDTIEFLEIFGNAIENENNLNSSRYMRVLNFFKTKNNSKLLKVKIKHYLFEKSRVLERFNDEIYNDSEQEETFKHKFNFHIIHAALEGLYIIFFKEVYNSYPEFSDLIKIFRNEYSNIFEKGLIEMLYKENNTNEYHSFYIEKFNNLLRLLQKLKITNKKLIKKIFNCILSVLLLLKIEFDVNEEGKAVIDEKDIYIAVISDLLLCDVKLLRDKLISREIRSPGGSFYVIRFSPEEANRTRNTFAKFLYENLFEYLTRYMNTLLNEEIRRSVLNISSNEEYINLIQNLKKEDLIRLTRVVECYGIENSEDCTRNSLESLCINYTNDKLNNILFEILIKAETELYKQEGIISNDLDFNNLDNTDKDNDKDKDKTITTTTNTSARNSQSGSNSRRSVTSNSRSRANTKMNYNKNNGMMDIDIENTLQALDDNNRGIFKLIDLQGSLINTNKGMIKVLCDNIKLNWPGLTTTDYSFSLVHFGSIVEYGASDLIMKNVDTVNDDLKEISNKFFKKFTQYIVGVHSFNKDKIAPYLLKFISRGDIKNTAGSQKDGGRNSVTRRLSQNIKMKSNTEKFLNSLRKLLNGITHSNVNYIKLINTSKETNTSGTQYDDKFILKQIYSSGIFESILLAKGGFFIRHNYEDLFNELSKYKKIFRDVSFENKNEFINVFAKIINIEPAEILIGKTHLFIKNNAVFKNKNLLNCKSLHSYAINSMIRQLFERFIKVYKLFKYFKGIGKKGKIKFLYSTIEDIVNDKGKQRFLSNLKSVYDRCNLNANVIQEKFRIYLKRRILKEKVVIFASRIKTLIEKNYKKNLISEIKLKYEKNILAKNKIIACFKTIHSKRKVNKLKSVKFLGNAIEKIKKLKRISTFFNNLKNIKDKSQSIESFSNIIKNIIETTNKRLFIERLKFFEKIKIQKVITIQNIFKNFKERKKNNIIRNIEKLGNIMEKITNFKNISNAFNNLKRLRKNSQSIEKISNSLEKVIKNSIQRFFIDRLQLNKQVKLEKIMTIQKMFKIFQGKKQINNLRNVNNLGNRIEKITKLKNKSIFFDNLKRLRENSQSIEIFSNNIEKSCKVSNQRFFIERLKLNKQIKLESIMTIQRMFKRFNEKRKFNILKNVENLGNTVEKIKLRKFSLVFENLKRVRENSLSIDAFSNKITNIIKTSKKRFFIERLKINKQVKVEKVLTIQNMYRNFQRNKNLFFLCSKLESIYYKNKCQFSFSKLEKFSHLKVSCILILQNIVRKFLKQIKNNKISMLVNIIANTNTNKIIKSKTLVFKKLKMNTEIKKKIEAINFIKKNFILYKIKKDHKSEILKIFSLQILKSFNKVNQITTLEKIKEHVYKKIHSVKNIQTFYRIYKINKNHKIVNFIEALIKASRKIKIKEFLYKLYSVQTILKIDSFVKEKIKESNCFVFSIFFVKIKLLIISKNNMAIKIINFFKSIYNNKENAKYKSNKLSSLIISRHSKNLKHLFNHLKRNSNILNLQVKKLQKFVRMIINNKFKIKSPDIDLNCQTSLKILFYEYSIKSFFSNFSSSYIKFLCLQTTIKKYLQIRRDAQIKSNQDLNLKEFFNNIIVRTIIKEIKDCSIFIKSLKSNFNQNKPDEMFTLHFGEVEIIDNYVQEDKNDIQKEESNTNIETSEEFSKNKTTDGSININSNSKNNSNKKIERKVFPTPEKSNQEITKVKTYPNTSSKKLRQENNFLSSSLCSKNHIYNKPPTTKFNIGNSNSTRNILNLDPIKNKFKGSLEVDISKNKTIQKKQSLNMMKNLNRQIQDEFSKIKKNDKIFDECTKELDSLMKDISKDLTKIKKEQNQDTVVDYAMLNREKKKKESNAVLRKIDEDTENKDINNHKHKHKHNHESICISGNYDYVGFKRICLSDQMKKI